jgi:hypothetical protein
MGQGRVTREKRLARQPRGRAGAIEARGGAVVLGVNGGCKKRRICLGKLRLRR